MRKILILCLLFIFTGCGDKDFLISCKNSEKSPGFETEEEIHIYFRNDDKITKVIKTYTYSYSDEIGEMSFDATLLTLQSLSSLYKTMNGIEITDLENSEQKKKVQYVFDFQQLSDEDLQKLDLNRNYEKTVESYKKTMTCE